MRQRALDEYRTWLPRFLSADIADLVDIRAAFRHGDRRRIEAWKGFNLTYTLRPVLHVASGPGRRGAEGL